MNFHEKSRNFMHDYNIFSDSQNYDSRKEKRWWKCQENDENNGNKAVLSRLPLRARSVTDRGCSMPRKMIVENPTWGDRKKGGGKVRSLASLYKELPSKSEVCSREPPKKELIYSLKGQQCIFNFPKHRNNSSCVGTLKYTEKNGINPSKIKEKDRNNNERMGFLKHVKRNDERFLENEQTEESLKCAKYLNRKNSENLEKYEEMMNEDQRHSREKVAFFKYSKKNDKIVEDYIDKIKQNKNKENNRVKFSKNMIQNNENLEIYNEKLKEKKENDVVNPESKPYLNTNNLNSENSRYNKDTEKNSEERNISTKKNQSIFKFFKLKVNLYRDKMVGNNEMKSVTKKVENKVAKKSSLNILENPKTKDFLLKLYNECKKLNGNITKLYSDTNKRSNPTNNNDSFWNGFDKNKNSKTKSGGLIRRSRSAVHLNLKTISKSSLDQVKDGKKSESEISTGNVHEGHYYHLACVISPDIVNTSTNVNKNPEPVELSEKHNTKPLVINKALSDEVTNISSVKSNLSYTSSKSSENEYKTNNVDDEPNISKDKYTFMNEFDDTLCDLDEDMRTDSSTLSIDYRNVDFNEQKSPPSHYVTASDEINNVEKNVMGEKNRDSVKISSSMEFPPIPSIIDCDMSDFSFKIDPPRSTEVPKDFNKDAIFSENHSAINRFISVFEKQFPQRFVLHPSYRNDDYDDEDNKDPFSKFTSSLTVNCSKSLKKNESFREKSSFFNPFKPPICQTLRSNASGNSNNSNVGESDQEEEMDKVRSRNSIPEFTNHKDNLDDENVDKDLNNNDENDESCKRVAPLKQLLQHVRTSEQMNDVISQQQKEAESGIPFNDCIERQRQKKIARQQEQHQKAKDMAVEAARLRKERQLEMQTFDSFDSSRIMKKLFTDEQDDDYPEYSLFDAIHYNFTNKKPKKQRPCAQSTITGILPEGDPEVPEPPKSPLTTEKFRSQPFQIDKITKPKKEFSKEELAKYEPINTILLQKTLEKPQPEVTNTVLHPITTEALSDNKTSKNTKTKERKTYSSSSSSNSNTSSESITSSSSSTESTSSSTSSASIKKTTKSRMKTHKSNNSKHISKSKNSPKNIELIKNKKKEKTPKPIKKIEKSERTKKKESKLESKNEEISEFSKQISKETSDMNVGTEINENEKRFNEIMAENKMLARSLLSNPDMKGCVSEKIDCHLNYQTKYKDNLLDHTLPLNLSIPTPNISLSSFVHELSAQLYSLADTVDILLNRMDVLEVNILDCSKYFVFR